MATDPQTLLSQSNCYACFGLAGTWRILELSLLAQWSAQSAVPIDPQVTAWVNRVIANGAASPSQNTITAVNTFWRTIKSQGFDAQFRMLNFFAPDSFIAACTPFIQGGAFGGLSLWTDVDLGGGGIHSTIINLQNGVNGNSVDHLVCGVVPAGAFGSPLNWAMSAYVSADDPNGAHEWFGANDGTNQFKQIYDGFYLGPTSSWDLGVSYFPCFVSGNLTPLLPEVQIYIASSAGFSQPSAINNDAFASPGYPSTGMWVFDSDQNGSQIDPSAITLSMVAMHTGFDMGTAQQFFNAIQALRIAFGGGFA